MENNFTSVLLADHEFDKFEDKLLDRTENKKKYKPKILNSIIRSVVTSTPMTIRTLVNMDNG